MHAIACVTSISFAHCFGMARLYLSAPENDDNNDSTCYGCNSERSEQEQLENGVKVTRSLSIGTEKSTAVLYQVDDNVSKWPQKNLSASGSVLEKAEAIEMG